MSERLDDLLTTIANEPFEYEYSKAEVEFFEKLEDLKKKNYRQYVMYVQIYNEIHNSKYDDYSTGYYEV